MRCVKNFFFIIILATEISDMPMPEIASHQGSWGERSCPRGATALHSVSVNWTHNLPTERRNSTTELLPPQRNLIRQCLGVTWCYDVPLGCYWGTNDRRWKVKLALTIYRDFMQNFFLSDFDKHGHLRTLNYWPRLSNKHFINLLTPQPHDVFYRL